VSNDDHKWDVGLCPCVEINRWNDSGRVANNKMINCVSFIIRPNDVASSNTFWKPSKNLGFQKLDGHQFSLNRKLGSTTYVFIWFCPYLVWGFFGIEPNKIEHLHNVRKYLTMFYGRVETVHEVLQDMCFQDWDLTHPPKKKSFFLNNISILVFHVK
jgi:hypothetical protein